MLINLDGYALCMPNMTGVGKYAYNLSKSIIKLDRSNQYSLFAFDFLKRRGNKKLLQQYFPDSKVDIRVSSLFSYTGYLLYYNTFRRLPYNFFAPGADIYHFFSTFAPEKVKGKVIATVHDMVHVRFPETMSEVNYKICRDHTERVCHQADIIITSSQNSKNEISEFMKVPEERIAVVNGAVDKSFFFPSPDRSLIRSKYKIENPYVLYLGTLEPRKNIPAILKAFNIVSKMHRDLRLVLSGGEGWKNGELFDLINQLDLREKVILTGYVCQEDLPSLYSCAEAFVFPSLYEGFGIPPLEAMACGTPVIVSNASSLPEVAGDAGIYVEPEDYEELAGQIIRIVEDSQFKKEMSEKSLLQADNFSWDKSAGKMIEIYNSIK